MATYRTPGVYVEEISTLPPSVASISTAIPAFIGYTENGPTPDENGKVQPVVKRINTLLDYRTLFGGASLREFTAKTRLGSTTELDQLTLNTPLHKYELYYNLSLYFQNGGGSCYIISIGNYAVTPHRAHFEAGLDALEKEDEPTLILLSDAVNLLPADDYYSLCQKALAQCKKLSDRFAILDVQEGDDAVKDFRDKIGSDYLSYGAAYYPYLQTTLNYDYAETDVLVEKTTTTPLPAEWERQFGQAGIKVRYTGNPADTPRVKIVADQQGLPVEFSVSPEKELTITAPAAETAEEVVRVWQDVKNTINPPGFELLAVIPGSDSIESIKTDGMNLRKQPTLSAIKSSNTILYNRIKSAIAQYRVVLPPSAAIAGIYASVDRDRGVWKAPANVSLSAVIGPCSKISHADQENLNIDPDNGKSINVLRAFTGKGTLVWGARTLAGNDNEWRYIPVRRLFLMIEESVQKATAFAVFEPNDATTWLKVKAMIESYLYSLWEQGALAGPTPEAAYFVEIGLGKTMTAQDILEGRMVVEIGVAAVRPAEFIILKFSHKMQEA